MNLVLTDPPAIEPVTLAETKLHLRVDHSADDAFITALITAAREFCEGYQRRAYIEQEYDLWLDGWPGGKTIELPRPPLLDVLSVRYYDRDDTEHTLAAARYWVDTTKEPGIIRLRADETWPDTVLKETGGVRVTFLAGYGDNRDDVPMMTKQAMLLHIGGLYENREAVLPAGHIGKELPLGIHALLWQDRFFG